MVKKKIFRGIGIILGLTIAVLVLTFTVRSQVEESSVFSESFSNITYKDAASSVAGWGTGSVTLNSSGPELSFTEPGGIESWIDCISAVGDIDGDNLVDIIATGSGYSSSVVRLEKIGNGNFAHSTFIEGTGVSGVPSTPDAGNCALTAGDYDGDGDNDFLLVVSNQTAPYALKRVWLYENDGSGNFTKIDRTAGFFKDQTTIGGLGWTSTSMDSVDFDGDGDIDIVLGNVRGEILHLQNASNRAISNNQKFKTLNPVITTGWTGRGVSTVSARDFDNDGDVDIIAGSVERAELRYYKNDGTESFTLFAAYTDPDGGLDDNQFDGAAAISAAGDFDNDGWMDFMIGTTDDPGATGLGGRIFYFHNVFGNFESSLIFDGNSTVTDLDYGGALFYDSGNLLDLLIGDSDAGTSNAYVFSKSAGSGYSLTGSAISLNVDPTLGADQKAVTKVQFLGIEQTHTGDPAGLTITYYVSNDGGAHWEEYAGFTGNDIVNKSEAQLPLHSFSTFGSDLRWKAVLTTVDEGSGVSSVSPRINGLEFRYYSVQRQEYSRTSVAASIVDVSGSKVELIIGGTFVFPGWQGHLRAYDISGMDPINSSYSELRTVTSTKAGSGLSYDDDYERYVSDDASIRWDAGEILNDRQASDRLIYTAYIRPGDTDLTRLEFADTNLGALEPLLNDEDGEDARLLNFVRGEGRSWKLGDINHSNPVVMGPPDGVESQMGAGYNTFKEDNVSRTKVMFVGTNDGMIHCFNVLNGAELWGYIPYNLLPRLREMHSYDPVTSTNVFDRKVYVDGSPAVADVKFGSDWKTILICGQGPGKGSQDAGGTTGNFYFALDVTDPTSPQPLWEFTHDTMGESWSVPIIGKVDISGTDRWLAFFGSGHDNDGDPNVTLGNVLYCVDVGNGSLVWSHTAADVDTSGSWGVNIPNAFSGAPTATDRDHDGYWDRVYAGDLDGRLWMLDFELLTWEAAAIYTDVDHYPIVTKPAVWLDPQLDVAPPRIYFGTGGDDRAPVNAVYSFIALLDNTGPLKALADMDWFMGTVAANRPSAADAGDLDAGGKVWADPQIEDFTVYFSTLTGSIENVDPVANLAGLGKLYARYIITKPGSSLGGSAFRNASGSLENLNLSIKTKAAVTLGEQTRTEGGKKKREVYIQEYDSTIQKLEQITGGFLKLKTWREVTKVIR